MSPIVVNPFVGTTPGTVCDYSSSCTVATAATAAMCSHAPLGFSSCPSYPDNLGIANGTSSTQIDLYSAQSGTGMGALCFASGSATATGCVGTTAGAFYDLGLKGSTAPGTFHNTAINLAVSSGP